MMVSLLLERRAQIALRARQSFDCLTEFCVIRVKVPREEGRCGCQGHREDGRRAEFDSNQSEGDKKFVHENSPYEFDGQCRIGSLLGPRLREPQQ